MATGLAPRTGEARDAVGRRLRLARDLRSMPATAGALAAGEITHSHANVLSRALNPRTVDAFARDAAKILVGAARKLTADQLVQEVEFWLRHAAPAGAEPGPEGKARCSLSQHLGVSEERRTGKECTSKMKVR